ncbi:MULTISPECIES: CpsD/CapB family tyrosine-protein kinase [Lysinibacillus]|uniref:non-specific protein-tyrosine kinase n=1 Tax=Lysinibacillus antri TaxID=2498145 RepID=A0A3S0PR70_9BACI|nr:MULTISPECIES: CpsD/CapB family tyrosine-protein kinase [Lysinibacillus]RUL55164.1 polysaccharide biosynthesis tyrosine autokinase [Lysinibacillus antri]TSI11324.1 CpsD/CapB family tyrosine-protein kinase [Lysinibacillus sp. BW-2-10]
MQLNKKKKQQPTLARKLIASSNPKSIITEQFRTIRTNIQFSMPDQEIKTILVTSSIPGEGKTTNAANLGVVFAQDGKRVLIVDADMRKPTMHHTFNLFNVVGLSNILTKQVDIQSAIHHTDIDNIDIIASGPIPPNPSELLSSKNLDSFINEVIHEYEIIIFDAPPLLSVTDAQILSNKCDGTLLIVKSGYVDKTDVIKAKASLEAAHAKILGVVLNNYKMPKTNNYYYY